MAPVDENDIGQWLTFEQAADSLGVSTRTVYRLIGEEAIEVVRVRGRRRITRRALLEYVNRGVTKPKPPPKAPKAKP